MTALQANVDVMTALRKFYVGLKANKHFPSPLRRKCKDDIESFTSNIAEAIDRFKMHISRANLLGVTISDRKELVRLKSNGALLKLTELDR